MACHKLVKGTLVPCALEAFHEFPVRGSGLIVSYDHLYDLWFPGICENFFLKRILSLENSAVCGSQKRATTLRNDCLRRGVPPLCIFLSSDN